MPGVDGTCPVIVALVARRPDRISAAQPANTLSFVPANCCARLSCACSSAVTPAEKAQLREAAGYDPAWRGVWGTTSSRSEAGRIASISAGRRDAARVKTQTGAWS